jgi:hypothetical protein
MLAKVGVSSPRSGKGSLYVKNDVATILGSNLKRVGLSSRKAGELEVVQEELHNNPRVVAEYDSSSRTLRVKFPTGDAARSHALTVNDSPQWPYRVQFNSNVKLPLCNLTVMNAKISSEGLTIPIPRDEDLTPAAPRIRGKNKKKGKLGVINELSEALDRLKLAFRMAPEAKLYEADKQLDPQSLRITVLKKVMVETEEEINL